MKLVFFSFQVENINSDLWPIPESSFVHEKMRLINGSQSPVILLLFSCHMETNLCNKQIPLRLVVFAAAGSDIDVKPRFILNERSTFNCLSTPSVN